MSFSVYLTLNTFEILKEVIEHEEAAIVSCWIKSCRRQAAFHWVNELLSVSLCCWLMPCAGKNLITVAYRIMKPFFNKCFIIDKIRVCFAASELWDLWTRTAFVVTSSNSGCRQTNQDSNLWDCCCNFKTEQCFWKLAVFAVSCQYHKNIKTAGSYCTTPE